MSEPIQEAVDQVEASASECCAQMRDKAAELCNTLEDYVRSEPLKSVLIAAGVGLVVGFVLTRR